MSWRESLKPASWRGVAFHTDGHEAQIGRRCQLHEFPLRDEPFVEDLGRRARVLTVEAYVLGADYHQARDRLLQALEQAGPGTLVHPYFGELRVSLIDCRLRETSAEGGMARLTLQFVEAGSARFPVAVPSTSAAVVAAADHAADAVRANFARRHTVVRRPAFVSAASSTILGRALDGIQGGLAAVRGTTAAVARLQADVRAVRRDLLTLVYTPASVASALVSSIRGLVRDVASTPRDALSLARTLYGFGADWPAVSGTTSSRRAQARNQAELVRLVRTLAAAEGARVATGVQWLSYQDAIAARDELLDTLDRVMLDPQVPDDEYAALHGLRAALVRDVAARGADLARLAAYTPLLTAPALVLAQHLYTDAQRAPELLARNRVPHPLFVPGAVALEVVANG